MNSNNYLSISEFAKLSGIKRKTLIYYDQIGLLTPEYTAENGYRYYDYSQIYTVNMINLFREIRMPLAEIKEHLQNSTPEQATVLLKRQQEMIQQKQDYYEEMAGMVDRHLASLEEYAKAERFTYSVVFYDQVPLFFNSKVYQASNFRASIPLSEMYQQSFAAGYQFLYPIGFMFKNTPSQSNMQIGEFSDVCPFIKVPNASDYRPAGDYLIYYFQGDMTKVINFDQMNAYLEEHHLKTKGDIYIDIILNGLSAQKFDDFLLKLLIEVVPI